MTTVKEERTAPAVRLSLPAEPGQRKYWADILRIFAVFLVIALHEAAQYFSSPPVDSSAFTAMNTYDALTHISVPLFVMISGMLFLAPSKKIPMRQLYGKYILRIAAALVFWSLVYAVTDCCKNQNWTFTHFARQVTAVPHLWFCFMIIGLYMLIPVLKKIAESKTLCIYFLALFFVFTSALPTLFQIAGLVKAETFLLLNKPFSYMFFQMTALYPSYFLLGYILAGHDFKKQQRYLIYFASVFSMAMSVGLSTMLSRATDTRHTYFYGNASPFTVIAAAGVFLFFRYAFAGIKLNQKSEKWLVRLSGDTFGIYLVHILVQQVLGTLGLNTMDFTPWLSIPVLALLIFLISAVISRILHLLPGIQKYLV